MRRDIYGALKNALDHGATIEQAIRSLVNAGYNDIEVREAANAITPGALSTLEPKPASQVMPLKPVNLPQRPPVQPNYPAGNFQQKISRPLPNQIRPVTGINPEKPKGRGKIIILSIILLILLMMLAGVLIFRDRIIEILAGIL